MSTASPWCLRARALSSIDAMAEKAAFFFRKDRDLGKEFLEKDHLAQEDIRAIADQIAGDVDRACANADSQEKKMVAIYEGLSFPYIFSKMFTRETRISPGPDFWQAYAEKKMSLRDEETGGEADVPEKVAAEAMEKVRQAVLKELKDRGRDDVFFIKDLLLSKGRFQGSGTRVYGLENGLLYKAKESAHLAKHRKERNRALARLFAALREKPHPNIAFSALFHGPRSGTREEGTVIKKRDFLALSEKMKEAPDWKGNITAVRDAMAGALFLEERGLVLEDICPGNIGVEKGRGMLFDFDGLFEAGTRLKSRLHHPPDGRASFLPPEVDKTAPTSIGPKEMVWQFGMCLFQQMKISRGEIPAETESGLSDLVYDRMLERDPESRIGLKGALEELELILAKTGS